MEGLSPSAAYTLGMHDTVTILLITGAGGPAGIALGKQLRERLAGGADLVWVGVDVVGVDDPNYPETGIVPRADDPGYPPGMRTAFERYGPDLIIPTVSEELPQLAVIAGALRMGVSRQSRRASVVLSSAQAAGIADDKLLTMWALDAAGWPCLGMPPPPTSVTPPPRSRGVRGRSW